MHEKKSRLKPALEALKKPLEFDDESHKRPMRPQLLSFSVFAESCLISPCDGLGFKRILHCWMKNVMI